MASEVILPRQGQSVETCLILEWKVRVGESVREGDPLCQVETDKAAFDIEAPENGTVLKICHQQGEDVPVLSVLALLGKPDEDISAWETAEAAVRAPEAAPAPPTGGCTVNAAGRGLATTRCPHARGGEPSIPSSTSA